MRHARKITRVALALGLGAGLQWGVVAERAAAAHLKLTGTIRAVQVEAGTCELVTGVGYAFRIRRVQLPSGLTIKTRSGKSTISALVPGSIVRVECTTTTEPAVASSVEVLEAPAARTR